MYIDSVYRPPWRARVCVNGSNIGLAFVPFVCLGPALSGIDLDSLLEIRSEESSKRIKIRNYMVRGKIRFIYFLLFRNAIISSNLVLPIGEKRYISNNEKRILFVKRIFNWLI